MQDHPSFVCMPALGDATTEATDNSEAMAAAQLARFLEEGAAARWESGRVVAPQLGRLGRIRPVLRCFYALKRIGQSHLDLP